MNRKIKAFFAMLLVGLLLFATTACTQNYSQEEVDNKLADLASEHDAEVAVLNEELVTLDDEKSSLSDELAEKETKIDELELELVETEEPVEELDLEISYLIEDVALDGSFEGEIDNDNLKTLFFGEVEYDSEDYDVEEVLLFSDTFKPVLNVEDFGSDVAIEIDSDGFSYELRFDEPIFLVSGEDLIVNFLGRELAIVSSDDNEITYRTSQKVRLNLNEEFTYQDNIIKVVGFDDGDINSVLLLVNDELKSLEEGKQTRINGVKIAIEDIFLSTIGNYNSVVLYVGEDIVETVSDTEEFEDDDRYDWIIESNADGISKIGVKLIEEYLEEDEVLALGDYLSLPYDYKTVTFDSLRELNVVDLKVSVRTDEIKVSFDGKIEIDGKKIDDAKFVYDGSLVEYEYRGEDKTTEFLSEIEIFVGDRVLSFEYDADTDVFSFIDVETFVSYDFGYNFVDKEITSAPEKMNEDDDWRLDNGDILYKSDANDADEKETSITLGLVNDDDKEVILKVV